jgi:hypothetical protein
MRSASGGVVSRMGESLAVAKSMLSWGISICPKRFRVEFLERGRAARDRVCSSLKIE